MIKETATQIVIKRDSTGEIIRRAKKNVTELSIPAQQPQDAPGRIVGLSGVYCPPTIGLKPSAPLKERMTAFVSALRKMDWNYAMSDSHAIWQRGVAWEQELKTEVDALMRLDPSLVVYAVAASGCGARF